ELTIRNRTNGASIGPTRPTECFRYRLRWASSKMGAANFMIRKIGMAEIFLSATCGSLPRTRRAGNRHFLSMAVRPGKRIGLQPFSGRSRDANWPDRASEIAEARLA